jgi:transcriptional regulator with PAS, ATPase and Fis domain
VDQKRDETLVLGAWLEMIDHLDEAVIVLDHQRILRHMNDPARRLLGYEAGQAVGGRCKLTTRGVDCENACPLTFAIKEGLKRVEDFATVYRTKDDRVLPLRVTVIPLHGEDGEFKGAVEILRPSEPGSGFFMSGHSDLANDLRERALAAARSRKDVMVVGEPVACRDVARALHRFSGAPEDLFRSWSGGWDGENAWPPGTVYADGDDARSLMDAQRPDGWRMIVGARSSNDTEATLTVLELPPLGTRFEDLPLMIGAWIEDLAPRKTASPGALSRLVRIARDLGLGPLEETLMAAVAVAGDRIEESHIPVDGYGTALVDELLQESDPLSALEERLLREVLERSEWRMQEAADRLCISRVTLWRKMKELAIEKPS